ncbi:MAG: hypothetical protein CM15mP92_0220 [Halieaceae bacterium]|nr:MAG: hypothetical protein CM15mP92_0220 [Halieaceae bacterium]
MIMRAFPIGYSKNSQQVLIPAFMSAFLGFDPQKIAFNPISNNPKLNWALKVEVPSDLLNDNIKRISLDIHTDLILRLIILDLTLLSILICLISLELSE